MFFCEVEERKFSEGPCLFERKGTVPNNKTCLECPHYLALHVKPDKRKKARSDKGREEYLKRWSRNLLTDQERVQVKGDFFDGSFEEVYKKLGQKWDPNNPYEHLKDYLLSYALRFIRETRFQMEVLSYKEKEIKKGIDKFNDLFETFPFLFKDSPNEVKERAKWIPNKRRILKPFYSYMLSMAILYEKYTGQVVKWDDKRFLNLIYYCLKSMRLSKVYSKNSVEKMSRKVIKTLPQLRPGPDELILLFP
jgi:hypothetical protein